MNFAASNFSFFSLFFKADFVVKFVIIILIAASIYSWAIIIEKYKLGLFGTVWGIMNSFQSIAISKNTSLAIVAPGIAEALFATALGLLAAIPAVVAYNKFTSDSRKYSTRLENFSQSFISIT
ncbi:MAG: hypothetical protein EBU53_01590 [Proteobacteria bacterium]|nr:hypothetical protein [Pseudomonadota bacterium]